MPAAKRAAKPAAQKRVTNPYGVRSRLPSGSRSRLQAPRSAASQERSAAAMKKSDRSRLQAPKSAASKARSRAAMKKRLSSQFKKMGGTIDSSAGSSYQMRPMSPMASTRDRITKALKQRERQGRSHLRRS